MTARSSWTGTHGVVDVSDLPNDWDAAFAELNRRCSPQNSIYDDPRVFAPAIRRAIEEFGADATELTVADMVGLNLDSIVN